MPKGVFKRPPRPRVDLTGKVFGKLTALYFTRPYVNKKGVTQTNYWMFKCECGVEKEILSSSVTRAKFATRSCGCSKKTAKENLGSQEKINFLRNGLRNLWLKWPPKYHTKAAAKVGRGVYLCAGYNREPHEVRDKETNVDHIVPIGELLNWSDYIDALFCPASNLQVLCKDCHDTKTKNERQLSKKKEENGSI